MQRPIHCLHFTFIVTIFPVSHLVNIFSFEYLQKNDSFLGKPTFKNFPDWLNFFFVLRRQRLRNKTVTILWGWDKRQEGKGKCCKIEILLSPFQYYLAGLTFSACTRIHKHWQIDLMLAQCIYVHIQRIKNKYKKKHKYTFRGSNTNTDTNR